MNFNILDLINNNSLMVDNFITLEKVNHIFFIILYILLVILANYFLNMCFEKSDLIKLQNTRFFNDDKIKENNAKINIYNFWMYVTVAFFIFCFIKIFYHSYGLIECFINPEFVYLKQILKIIK